MGQMVIKDPSTTTSPNGPVRAGNLCCHPSLLIFFVEVKFLKDLFASIGKTDKLKSTGLFTVFNTTHCISLILNLVKVKVNEVY